MQPRDLFEALLRVFGVVFFIFGIADLADAGVRMTSLPMSPGYTPGMVVVAAVLWLILGVTVIAATSRITRLFYGRDNSDR